MGDPPRTTAPVALGPSADARVALGEHHTCTLTADGQVRCHGYNQQGQLGVGSTEHPAAGFVRGIGEPSDGAIRSIAAGGFQTCALMASGHVWCWGQNHEGQAGSGEVTEAPVRAPIRVRGLENVVELVLGETTSCAVTSARALLCWGSNSHAQIDDSGQRHRLAPTPVAGVERVDRVAVGNYHLCVLMGGRVSCRGSIVRAGSDVGSLAGVSAIASGWEHSCAVQGGQVLCWGRSYLGGLGRGRMCPPGMSSTCDADTLYPPTPVPGVTDAVAIATHDYHSCVRRATGDVVCWGNNQGNAFADDLPAEPWQTAHPITALGRVDTLYVGGLHLCGQAGASLRCRGNLASGAVPPDTLR